MNPRRLTPLAAALLALAPLSPALAQSNAELVKELQSLKARLEQLGTQRQMWVDSQATSEAELTEMAARAEGLSEQLALLEARTTLGHLIEQASARRHSAQASPFPSF